MGRVKVKFPSGTPLHVCTIAVRITDLNYGNHLANDAVLRLVHEARMQLLAQWGMTELDCDGHGLIMADAMIAFRSEGFYNEQIQISVYAEEVTDRSFSLLYLLQTERKGTLTDVAHVKTGMVCFDYKQRQLAVMSERLRKGLTDFVF